MSITAQFVPALAVIESISRSLNALVTTESPHGFSVGAFVRLNIPNGFGMQQANGSQVLITDINSETQFTTNLNTMSFDAFSIPGGAKQSALAIPIGEFASFLASTKTNTLGEQPNGLIPPLA